MMPTLKLPTAILLLVLALPGGGCGDEAAGEGRS